MTSERYFTVAEAEALLPRLERTFREITALRVEMERRLDRLKILDALWGAKVSESATPDREEFLVNRSGLRRAMEGIERLVEERILSEGIRFPQGGMEAGLVDFPTNFDGRTVYLCWRVGEERIEAWHEIDGGFAGRRPLTVTDAERMGPPDS